MMRELLSTAAPSIALIRVAALVPLLMIEIVSPATNLLTAYPEKEAAVAAAVIAPEDEPSIVPAPLSCSAKLASSDSSARTI